MSAWLTPDRDAGNGSALGHLRQQEYHDRVIAARGESQPAFDERRILAAGVAPPSNTGGMLGRRAWSARRLARLDATPDFHHGLLALSRDHPARHDPIASIGERLHTTAVVRRLRQAAVSEHRGIIFTAPSPPPARRRVVRAPAHVPRWRICALPRSLSRLGRSGQSARSRCRSSVASAAEAPHEGHPLP